MVGSAVRVLKPLMGGCGILFSPYPLVVIKSHEDHCQDLVLLVIRDVKARKEMLSKPQLLKRTTLETESQFQVHVAK